MNPALDFPCSQACTYDQFQSSIYLYWCKRMQELPRPHRKQWEFVYIAQVLATRGKLAPGRSGLGFGVGQEPLPALFASYGCEVLATDLEPEIAKQEGWTDTDQHAAGTIALSNNGVCLPEEMERLVQFANVNMTNIPLRLRGFDFTWSACCLEHLGSIEAGLTFIEHSIATLKPGGIAVHTTELNCDSDTKTIDNAGTVLFRRSDFKILIKRLTELGHNVAPLNFELGTRELDRYVDVPPYTSDRHLKLKIGEYTSTSFGIVITKKL